MQAVLLYCSHRKRGIAKAHSPTAGAGAAVGAELAAVFALRASLILAFLASLLRSEKSKNPLF